MRIIVKCPGMDDDLNILPPSLFIIDIDEWVAVGKFLSNVKEIRIEDYEDVPMYKIYEKSKVIFDPSDQQLKTISALGEDNDFMERLYEFLNKNRQSLDEVIDMNDDYDCKKYEEFVEHTKDMKIGYDITLQGYMKLYVKLVVHKL